jgi:hypothetical protein
MLATNLSFTIRAVNCWSAAYTLQTGQRTGGPQFIFFSKSSDFVFSISHSSGMTVTRLSSTKLFSQDNDLVDCKQISSVRKG